MTPHPYSVECETLTPTTRSYLREWFATRTATREALAQHQQEDWQRVEEVPSGQIPRASIAGKQVLAWGAINLPRQRRPSTKGA